MAWPVVRPLALSELSRNLETSNIGRLSLAEIEFQNLLSQVRERGMESCEGSMLRHINAIAAPFKTERSELVGVMSVIGDAGMLDVEHQGFVAMALLKSALDFQMTPG